MSALTIFLCTLLYAVLGVTWVKGADYVKEKAPEHLPVFYMALAIIRVVFILTAIGVYLIFVSESHAESVSFVVMMLLMYAIMMTVTLVIKH